MEHHTESPESLLKVPPQHRGPEVLGRSCISIEDPADSVSLSDRRLWTGECAQSRAKIILSYLGSLNSHLTFVADPTFSWLIGKLLGMCH